MAIDPAPPSEESLIQSVIQAFQSLKANEYSMYPVNCCWHCTSKVSNMLRQIPSIFKCIYNTKLLFTKHGRIQIIFAYNSYRN